MPRDPLTENELIAQLMGAEPDAAENPVTAEDVAELLDYTGAVVAAQHSGSPKFQRVYLAGPGKAVFVFDLGNVLLEIPEDVLDELRPAAEALLRYLEGDHA